MTLKRSYPKDAYGKRGKIKSRMAKKCRILFGVEKR